MKPSQIQAEIRIKTIKLRPRAKLNVDPIYLQQRRLGALGTVRYQVVGTRQKVWWVDHGDGTLAPYHHSELEPHTTAQPT